MDEGATKIRILAVGLVLTAWLAGAGLAFAFKSEGPGAVTTEQLIAEALAGDPGKQVDARVYTFPPRTEVPWHIHPDAHEISYVIEGTLTFQQAGEAPREMTMGSADYLALNVVHRGMNNTDKPVKLFVVRIKPTDKPLVEEVPPPQ
jgi:quercetin dioxygenase-like cupin family protein